MNNTTINKKDLLRPDDSRDYRYFISQISEREIETFREQILNGTFLTDITFSYNSRAKHFVRLIMLSRVMTVEETEAWFEQCCYKYLLEQPKEERFPIRQKKYFRKILGHETMSQFKKDSRISNLIEILTEAYFKFKKANGYDPELIVQLENNIRNLKPLNELRNNYDKVHSDVESFFNFLESRIDNEISQTEIVNYFKSMAFKLQQELGMGARLRLTISDLENYIFGQRIDLRPGRFKKQQIKPVKLVTSFYRSVFPFITKSLSSAKYRQSIYQFCELSEKEQEDWERVYQQNCYHKESEILNLNDSNPALNIFRLSKKEVNLLEESLDKILIRYYELRTVPKMRELKIELLKEVPTLKELINDSRFNSSLKRKELNKILANRIKKVKEYLFKTQFDEEFKLSRDIWHVYCKTSNGYFYNTLNFTPIKNQKLREDLKIIALEDIRISQGKNHFADRMPALIKITSELENKYQIESFNDLLREHLIALYHHYRLHENKSVSRITKYNRFLKFAFETLALSKEEYKNLKNLPELIRVSTKGRSIKTEVIPDPVVENLLEYLDESPTQIALMLELFLESGWRYKEIAELKPSSFVEDRENPEFVRITGIISKTRRSHQKNGLGENISCFITRELYEKIKNFIEDTKAERKNYNIKTLFYSIKNGQVRTISHSTFNHEINALIKRHHICDSKGELWKFSSRQIRTTVATDLINSGASITSVQKQLNHLNPDTTAAYYARPDRHQTALINQVYFNQSTGEQEEKKDTLFEKINLYEYEQDKSFMMIFGRCSRPEGPCEKGLQNQCVSCPKLLVSRDSLSHWKKLLDEAQRELSLYEECCHRMGINLSELEHFSEYLSLKELCHSYESLIRKAGDEDA